MTSDRLVATGVTLRWYTRSVTRRFDSEVEAWEKDPPEDTGIHVKFGAQIVEPDDDEATAPSIRVRLVLYLEQPKVSAELDGGAEFSFGAGEDLAPDQAADFVREQGIPYLLGMQRGVLADMTRSVGLPAVMIPPVLPTGLLDAVDRTLFGADEDEPLAEDEPAT
ncbi:hypothetical protein [Mycobacterium colombiense]|uniref:Preprotein translocase subunit SecB n=1 Tax=Mycobacterium colombiense CECT 3035 TaxID=1041522 RepID=J4SFR1_9MYCO|nr:hypothetical protein [Mycobacterium colombiense]EJO88070.1 hypothetical protein MCOL_V214109 [Mycobacterium colombiense CECT 3035]